MFDENIEPYDFNALDTVEYDPANPASYTEITNHVLNDVSDLQQQAWGDAESQSTNDADAYLKKYVIAQWRSFEVEHAEDVVVRHGRGLPIYKAVILGILMRSDEVDDDFLDIASQYTREELLRKISEASAPWLKKYKLRLDYDSEVEDKHFVWEIFMDAQVS
ncbi:MAG: hypothetical protein JWO55_437 [Candidatus Saccharibacteria bacterium]|jgi:hypothetical protein|nr:hypothetical protein [Candidatus Saccharibacteria bacterium]